MSKEGCRKVLRIRLERWQSQNTENCVSQIMDLELYLESNKKAIKSVKEVHIIIGFMFGKDYSSCGM